MPEQTFLSYSHNDRVAADLLRDLLLARGIELFKDDASLRSGDRWLQRLQQAVAGCSAFIVLVGRDGVQRWVGAEVEVALNRHLSARGDAPRLPIHPVLLGDTDPAALPPFLALFQAERWAPGDPLPYGLLAALMAGRERLDTQARFEGCPFLGLGAFQPKDAALFFGRRAETLEALAGLGDQSKTGPEQAPGGNGQGYHRWLQIEGNSGSGKSSLVLAGLLPMVERGALWPRTGYAHWRILGPMMPGKEPVTRLAEALEQTLKPDGARDIGARRDQLARDETALALGIRAYKQADTAFLLVIDQFEELFTLADEAQRKRFDALLATALLDADCPLFVLSTVRADFLDRIDQLPRLSALSNQRCKRYLLPTITPEGLREAIELPARLAGLDVSEVTTVMLEEAKEEPGALPLVENALLELWRQRSDGKLSGAVYRQRNGLAGMLSQGADALLARIEAAMPRAGRAGALELLLALTRFSAGGRHTRQRLTRDEAVLEAGKGSVQLGERVLNMLAGERSADQPGDTHAGSLRLITISSEGEGQDKVVWVDLIHETLLRARRHGKVAGSAPEPYWPTLHHYIEANRDRPLLRQQLALQLERRRQGGRFWRRFRLASWRELLEYRRLRVAPESTEGRFLALSKRVAGVQIGLLLGLASWGSVTWWQEIVNSVAKGMNTAVYLAVLPFWYAEWEWALPVPEVVELPPLAAGRTFDMGCRVGRDGIAQCPATEPSIPTPMPNPCAMGKYEVTNLQYNWYLWNKSGRGIKPLFEYPADGIFGTPGRPVVNVDWYQARDYTVWLQNSESVARKPGQTFRLPTNAEWEYAARLGKDGVKDQRYPWGNEEPGGRANCANCADGFSGKKTAPVGSYASTGPGLSDMAGNVWEWVGDGFESGSTSRVLRGGSWDVGADGLRVANRYRFPAINRYYGFGFRVCRGSPIE
jgi:formylglycine-generating enzyme required for sulfatase activity